MGFLAKFEKGLERVVTGAFSKTFKSELQPIEIASYIRAEMDAKASVVTRDRILAPNTFTVRLSNSDYQRLRALGSNLINELTNLTAGHARKQGFQFGAAVEINLVEDASLALGQVEVSSTSQQIAIEWAPAVDFAGQRVMLRPGRTTVGRDASADLQVDDQGLSRKHFELLWDGTRAGVRDLGSTNGTTVNGQTMTESPLKNDDVIHAGRTEFVFRILANKASNE